MDKKLKILQQVTEMVHSSLDLKKIFKHITDGVVRYMGFTTAIFFMLDQKRTRFEVKALTTRKGLLTLINTVGGISIKNFSIPAELTLNAAIRSAMNGQTVVVKTLEEIVYPLISKKRCADLQKLGKTKTLIILPLENDGEVIGAVFITSKQEEIPEEELEMIKSFSLAASNAIKNADLHQQVKKAYEKISSSKVALRASESKYGTLFKSIADPIFIFDKKTHRFLDCNKAALDRYGYTLKKLKTMTPYDLHPVEDLKDVDKNINDDSDLSAHQYTHITKKGERLYVEIHTAPLEYEGEEAWISIIRDITLHQQAEAEIKRSHEELKKLTAHLQTVREEERTLVAYELHDDIGQGLSALKMDLYMLEKKFLKGEKNLSDRFQKTKDLLDNMIQTTRKIYTDLRPTLLEHFSIKEVVEDYVDKFQDLTKITGVCEIDLGETSLDEGFSLALFRIVQEALNNVKWHSQATKVTIRLVKENKYIELKIKDNGIGIKDADLKRPSSFGIIGMRERANLLGGKLDVRAVPNKGTLVLVHFPLS